VGFRPFLHGLARRHGLTGWVLNDGQGVQAEVQGDGLDGFLADLMARTPPLARIDGVDMLPLPHCPEEHGFTIRESRDGGAVSTAIGPDAAVCPDCLAELCDPADRRWRYPFITCTHCGPRFTIAHGLPYDRSRTSMAGFPLCPACAAEYHDPADRRFHAQPLACPACGPRLSHAVADIVAQIRAGRIVALKGLGGFHLVCDARNDAAVARLRRAKQRDGKPFAIMVLNLESANRFVALDAVEQAALADASRPIVLLRKRDGAADLSPAIAPGLDALGVMLPYTPLHYLLFHTAMGEPFGTAWLGAPCDLALVMTSANPGGEPLVIDDAEAVARLSGLADIIVGHDRGIVVRADDPVVRVVAGRPRLYRRGRGFVPVPIPLAQDGPPVLALGGYLKSAVCVTRGREAFLSQHIGDLDDAASLRFLEETVDHLLSLLRVRPVRVAHDLHPDFPSTHLARSFGLPCLPVQHHHAHVAAVCAERGVTGPVIGLALDGYGMGADGDAWGGELLLVDGARCMPLGHLRPLPQPGGGDVAARQPWRMAAAALHLLGRGREIPNRYGIYGPAGPVADLLARSLRCPPTRSAGRWFDAACGLLDVVPVAGFEGQAPLRLEALVRIPRVVPGGWSIGPDNVLDLLPLLAAIDGRNPVDGADLWHGTLVAALVDWSLPALVHHGLTRIALSGGCLMNRVLAEGLVRAFADHGVTALLPALAPANDGGLALGQAWVAGRSEPGDDPCA